MGLRVPENQRTPWSRITDTSILKKGDLLTLFGVECDIRIAVLDSHDPRSAAEERLQELMPDILQHAGVQSLPLPNHHHVLVQFKDASVVSTGLYVGKGSPDELFFAHITRLQIPDPEYNRRLRDADMILHSGNHGLYYVSDQEDISQTPQGTIYLDEHGGLLR